jgi:hypothetical protein
MRNLRDGAMVDERRAGSAVHSRHSSCTFPQPTSKLHQFSARPSRDSANTRMLNVHSIPYEPCTRAVRLFATFGVVVVCPAQEINPEAVPSPSPPFRRCGGDHPRVQPMVV